MRRQLGCMYTSMHACTLECMQFHENFFQTRALKLAIGDLRKHGSFQSDMSSSVKQRGTHVQVTSCKGVLCVSQCGTERGRFR